MATETVLVVTPAGFRKFRARLEDPRGALDAIGVFLVSESARAFTEQRLGEFTWHERYPNQDEPFINVAGVLEWAKAGATKSGNPPARFFSRRPALVGTRRLMRGTAYRIASSDIVEVGNAVPYAAMHQYGGSSTIVLTNSIKTWIAKWTETKRGRPYVSKLYHLLDLPEWTTEVYKRPFIGVTPEAGQEIRRIVEVFVSTGKV